MSKAYLCQPEVGLLTHVYVSGGDDFSSRLLGHFGYLGLDTKRNEKKAGKPKNTACLASWPKDEAVVDFDFDYESSSPSIEEGIFFQRFQFSFPTNGECIGSMQSAAAFGAAGAVAAAADAAFLLTRFK